MLSELFGKVTEAITDIFGAVGAGLNGGVNLIYDSTANQGAGALTNFGILVTIPMAAGLVWVAYHVLKRCITVRG